jgi:hypothetical protein
VQAKEFGFCVSSIPKKLLFAAEDGKNQNSIVKFADKDVVPPTLTY